MQGHRLSNESGSVVMVILAMLAAIGILTTAALVSTEGASAKSEAIGNLERSISAQHANALATYAALLTPSNHPTKIPAIFPHPYLTSKLDVQTLQPPGRLANWRIEAGCFKIRQSLSGGIDVTKAAASPFTTGDATSGQVETVICPTGAARNAALPYRMDILGVSAVTKIVQMPSTGDYAGFNSASFFISSQNNLTMAPPPKPHCRIEVPDDTISMGKKFTASFRSYGVVTAAWFEGKKVSMSDELRGAMGVADLVLTDSTGKLGRSLLGKQLKAWPTHMQVTFSPTKSGSFRKKIVAGVEGVDGASSRAECSSYVNIKLPTWMKVAFTAVRIAVAVSFTCFGEGTEIGMADGGTKRIELLKVGDVVRNPVTGVATRVARVTRSDYDGPMRRLSVGASTLDVTPKHPMLTASGIEAAEDLGALSSLYRADARAQPTETIVETLPAARRRVYNLALETESDDPTDRLVAANGVIAGDLALQTALSGEPAARELMSTLDEMEGVDP